LRLQADSRQLLTLIRTGYSGRRGGVPSRAPYSTGVVAIVPGMALRARGGRTGPTVAGMVSRQPTVMIWPCKFTRKHFEGAAGPPSRARRVSRTGVGGAGSRG
jgi:hypothetical protein